MEKLTTELGKSYWGQDASYSEQYKELYDKLVPSEGEAETQHGEMLRCISRLIYDYNNNGNCNVLDINYLTEMNDAICFECNGNGQVDEYDDEGEIIEEECENCCGEGYFEEDEEVIDGIIINPYYQDMINYLEGNLKNSKNIKLLQNFLISDEYIIGYDFNDKHSNIYDLVMDDVMYEILTTENKKNV